ncbi:MAG TPA: fumarylacetoacetate hydrolase family protein, partial [Bauldia sp.]|nr:fumarylacetoacetate hydrolase family protein [Bauldia sp.]
IERAAGVLLKSWRGAPRVEALPEDCRPRDRAEGYAIAAALARQSHDVTAGWKIAATSEAGQRHINVDGPLAGRILKGRLVPPGGAVPLNGNIMRVAEAEFAFVLGKAMPERGAPYTRDEVMEAVTALHLSIEVPDSRYVDFTSVGAPSLIADLACPSWLMLGPKVEADWRVIDLSTHMVSAYKNGVQAASGSGKAVLGDPRIALTWLVNEAARYCGGVEAGQFVTTGTCIVPVAIAPGDEIRVEYGALGSLTARIG